MIQIQRFQLPLASINIDRNTLALALFLVFFSVLVGCDNSNSNNDIAEEIAQQTQALTQTDHLPSEQAAINTSQSEPTADDIVALASVMHGSVNQQPDDAPKDKYGKPYIIGNLGGFAVKLPSSVVYFVDYNDSLGWDMNAVRNYQPPVGNDDSLLNSFRFDTRIADGQVLNI